MPHTALAALAAALAVSRLPASASLQLPQDTGTVVAPAYENAAFGISLPRPFDDWVFEPGADRQTTTVIFHPRDLPLRGQLWGALILTTFRARVPLGLAVDQRVQETWRPRLGPAFQLVSRDSLLVGGLAAIHVVMSGEMDQVALDVEEFAITRGRDLILLQFHYPRTLPRDSLAAGYRRVLEGLRVRGAVATPAPPAPRAVAPSVTTPRELPWSVWQARSYDALVRYDTAGPRADFTVQVNLLNDGPVPAESVTVWLWPVLRFDSARSSGGPLEGQGSARMGVVRFRLSSEVQPQDSITVTLSYHVSAESAPELPPSDIGLAADGAYLVTDWLPRVQPLVDSAGQLVRNERPRFTTRFDVPDGWRAVAPGRLTTEVVAAGRRRVTWTTEQVTPDIPAFALGPYQVRARREGGIPIAIWVSPRDDSLDEGAVDTLIAAVRSGWTFCSRAFGRLPISEVSVVSADVPGIRGFAGLLLMGRGTIPEAADSASRLGRWRGYLYGEIARTWWGGSVEVAGPGSAWLAEALPAWSAVAARAALEGDTVRQRLLRQEAAAWRADTGASSPPLSTLRLGDPRTSLFRLKGVAALEAARRAAGEARFREAILSFALEHRNGWATWDDLLAALGPDAVPALRPFLY